MFFVYFKKEASILIETGARKEAIITSRAAFRRQFDNAIPCPVINTKLMNFGVNVRAVKILCKYPLLGPIEGEQESEETILLLLLLLLVDHV